MTVWNSAPALLDVMLDDGPGAAAGLRLALVSGDWVPLGLRSKLPEGVLLVAMGGATEAGIWSNYFEVLPPMYFPPFTPMIHNRSRQPAPAGYANVFPPLSAPPSNLSRNARASRARALSEPG